MTEDYLTDDRSNDRDKEADFMGPKIELVK